MPTSDSEDHSQNIFQVQESHLWPPWIIFGRRIILLPMCLTVCFGILNNFELIIWRSFVNVFHEYFGYYSCWDQSTLISRFPYDGRDIFTFQYSNAGEFEFLNDTDVRQWSIDSTCFESRLLTISLFASNYMNCCIFLMS